MIIVEGIDKGLSFEEWISTEDSGGAAEDLMLEDRRGFVEDDQINLVASKRTHQPPREVSPVAVRVISFLDLSLIDQDRDVNIAHRCGAVLRHRTKEVR